MQLPQIQMESQMAKIQIQQTAGRQQIKQPKAALTIQQPRAEVSIHTIPSKLQIDQMKAWEDMDLMHIFKRNEKFAQTGKNKLLEGIGRRAQQGTELMQIESKGDPIVSQAMTNAHDHMKPLGITFTPSRFAVETSYQPAKVEIDVQRHRPIIDAQARRPIHHYEPGSVDTSMKQHQNLEIDFINLFA